MGGFEAGHGALGKRYVRYLGMGHTGDEGIAGPGGVDDTGGDGLELLVAGAVAAKNALAAQRDIDLVHPHGREMVSGFLGGGATCYGLGFLEVELERMQAMVLALLQCLDGTGSLGGAHGIDHEWGGAVTDEVLQGLGGDVGVGHDKDRAIDGLDAGLKEFGRDPVDDVGVGNGGDHVARLVVDTQVQAVAHALTTLAQRKVQSDGLALTPAHLAEGLAAESAHKLHLMPQQLQVVGDVTRHAAASQGHLSRHRVGRNKGRRQCRRDVHVDTPDNSNIFTHVVSIIR